MPGINTEIAQFAASGGHFSRGDVVTLWGGANNYFEYADIIEANPASGRSDHRLCRAHDPVAA